MDLQTKTYRLFDIYPDIAREYAKKLHKKKEDIPYTQKFYSSSKSEASDADRTIVSYISTSDVDRDNEVLLPKGMSTKHYEASGKPVFWGHRYDEPKDVVGQCQWLKIDAEGTGVIAKTAFRNTEFADEVYQLYGEDLTGQGPILRGFSVGFIPLEWETGKKESDPRRTYTKWELLEFSFVSIPCNPNAQTILGQKGIKLCDKLQHDLGFNGDADGDIPEDLDDGDAVIPPEKAMDTVTDIPAGKAVAESGADVETSARMKASETFSGPTFATLTIEPIVSETETKDAPISAPVETAPAGVPVTVTPEPPDIAAALMALNERLAGIEARLAPVTPVLSPVETTPAAAADFIAIDPEPDVLAGLDVTPASPPAPAPASAPKSIDTMTEDQIIEAVGRAVANLDLRSLLKELVDLSLDKLRGRVR